MTTVDTDWNELAEKAEAALETGHLARAAKIADRLPTPSELPMEKMTDGQLLAVKRVFKAGGAASKRLSTLFSRLGLRTPPGGDLREVWGDIPEDRQREVKLALTGREDLEDEEFLDRGLPELPT